MSRKRIKVEETMASLPVAADDEEFTVDTRYLSPAHFLTEIKSFSLLSNRGISEIESMEFKAGGCKWKLTIYLDGDEKGKEVKHISVSLSMVGTVSVSLEVNAIVQFFIYNHISTNYLCFRGRNPCRFLTTNSKWGISKLMDKKRFTDPSNGYLLNDICAFGAEVFVIKNKRVIENLSVLSDTNPCICEWTIPDFSKLGNLWNSEEFSAGGFKWKILLYPKGAANVNGGYMSIFVACVESSRLDANEKVKATCLYILRNKLNDARTLSKQATHWFTSSESDWGFSRFIEIGEATSKGFIANDRCHVKIQLSVEAIQKPLKLESKN